jgi:hypothetical protein
VYPIRAPDRAGCAARAPRKRPRRAVDGRTSSARRLKALIAAFAKDLGELSQVDQALIRTAATLTLKMEMIEAALAGGQHVDSDELIRLASTSRRALAAVTAKAKPAGGNALQTYLDARAAAAAATEEDGDDGEES